MHVNVKGRQREHATSELIVRVLLLDDQSIGVSFRAKTPR
jgi:hypothetical protein